MLPQRKRLTIIQKKYSDLALSVLATMREPGNTKQDQHWPSSSPSPEAFKPRMSPTSLSMLLPNFSNSPRYKGVTSAPSATSAELERLTEIGIDLYNNRKFAELAQSGLISIESIKVNQDGNVKKADFNGHMQYHQAVLRENPSHKSRIVEFATDVDDRKGEGTVFALLEVTGYPSTICRQMISVVKWKRNIENGKWQIANVSNMRGAQGFA